MVVFTCYKRLYFFTVIKEIRITNRYIWQRAPTPYLTYTLSIFKFCPTSPSPAPLPFNVPLPCTSLVALAEFVICKFAEVTPVLANDFG